MLPEQQQKCRILFCRCEMKLDPDIWIHLQRLFNLTYGKTQEKAYHLQHCYHSYKVFIIGKHIFSTAMLYKVSASLAIFGIICSIKIIQITSKFRHKHTYLIHPEYSPTFLSILLMKEPPPPFRVNQQYLGLLIQQINESVADISRALTYSWCSSQVEKKNHMDLPSAVHCMHLYS